MLLSQEAEGGDGQIGNVSRELCDMIAYSKLLEASPLTNESKELQSLAIVLNETVRSHCIIVSQNRHHHNTATPLI